MNENQTIVAEALKAAGFTQVEELMFANNAVVVGLGSTGTTINVDGETYKHLTSTLAAMGVEALADEFRKM